MNFWLYLGFIILAVVSGAVFILIVYGGWNIFRDKFFYKRGIPRDKKSISEFIKNNPDKFENTNPGFPSEEDKKEVEKDERRRGRKYREFDKLRQLELKGRTAKPNRGSGDSKKSKHNSERITELQGRSVLPDVSDSGDKGFERGSAENKPRVKLDDE